MSKFNKLFNDIIAQMNINLMSEATCAPDTMLNQSDLNKKKIPQQRKATVTVKSDGNTTGITYTVDSDTSAEMMADNIKANGGDAVINPSSGVSNELNNTQTQLTDGQKYAKQLENMPFEKTKYEEFLAYGKQIGIDQVTKYLQQHSAQVSQDFNFGEALQEEYFIEYALVRYNNEV